MADLVLSDSLTLSDSTQVGRGNRVQDQITLSDSVVVELGPILSTQSPTEVFSTSGAIVHFSQAPLEILTSTSGLIEERISDTLTLTDSKIVGRGLTVADTLTMTDSASAVASQPTLLVVSDQITTLADSVQTRQAVQIQLAVSDSITTLTDSVTTLLDITRRRLSQAPAEILTGAQSNVRMTTAPVEVLVPVLILQLHLFDTMTLTDQADKTLASNPLHLTEQMVMSDSIRIVGVVSLSVSDSLNQWTDSFQTLFSVQISVTVTDDFTLTDSVTTQSTDFIALSETFTESMNFWADSITEVSTFFPRVAPTGDPNENCCPPNIFITD